MTSRNDSEHFRRTFPNCKHISPSVLRLPPPISCLTSKLKNPKLFSDAYRSTTVQYVYRIICCLLFSSFLTTMIIHLFLCICLSFFALIVQRSWIGWLLNETGILSRGFPPQKVGVERIRTQHYHHQGILFPRLAILSWKNVTQSLVRVGN